MSKAPSNDSTKEPSPNTENPKHKWLILLRPRYAIPLIVIALLIALPLSYRSSQIARLPDVGDPFDVEEFLSYTVPDERNAYVEYRQAEKLWVRFQGKYEVQSDPKNWNWNTASPEIKKWFDDNQAALKVWYRGTKKPEGQYIHPRDISYHTLLPVIDALYELNQLAILHSSKLQTEKKYAEAWGWLHAAIRCTRHSGNPGAFIERSVGQKHFERTIPHIIEFSGNEEVDGKLLERMLGDLKNNIGEMPNLVEILKLEYIANQRFLEDGTFKKYFQDYDSSFDKWKIKTYFWLNGIFEVSPKLVKIVYRNRLEYLAKPRRDRPEIKGFFDAFCDSSGRVLGTDLTWQELDNIALETYSGEYLGNFAEIEREGIREQASQHCLEVVLAAQIYKRKHGTFPSKLEDLKEILGEIPADPFVTKPNQPLHYRKENNGFVVWSVGEDGIDNGGDVGTEEDKKYGDVGFRVKQ